MLILRHATSLSAALVLISLSLTACESTQTSTTVSAINQPDVEATADPRSERDSARAEAFNAAIEGLSFDTGFVVVDNPPQHSDLALAQEALDRGEAAFNIAGKTRAVAAFADAVRAAPDMPIAYRKLGDALLLKGKPDMAYASYNTAIHLEPGNIDHRLALGYALGRGTDRIAAIKAMEDVLDLDPANGAAHERLAIWYYYENNYTTAWDHVFAARKANYPLPPQFINLLEEQMPEPR